jgi:hypothetical protein
VFSVCGLGVASWGRILDLQLLGLIVAEAVLCLLWSCFGFGALCLMALGLSFGASWCGDWGLGFTVYGLGFGV